MDAGVAGNAAEENAEPPETCSAAFAVASARAEFLGAALEAVKERGASPSAPELAAHATSQPPASDVTLTGASLAAPLDEARAAAQAALCTSVAEAGSKLESLKVAAAAYLVASKGALSRREHGVPDGGMSVGSGAQAAGCAQHTSRAHRNRFTFTFTAVVASCSAVDESHCAAEVFCFRDSVLQLSPPLAVLDCLRAKATATEFKAEFGLQIRGCDFPVEHDSLPAPQCPAHVSLRFSNSDVVHPELITLHRSCQPLSPDTTPPTLGRKREAALVKAALFAALREFKAATGGGTQNERRLRNNGLPAIAAAVAKIAAAGGDDLRACGAALTEGAATPDETEVLDGARARQLEAAVRACLLETLAGDPPAAAEAPVSDSLDCTATHERPSPADRAHSRDDSLPDDEDVFPQRRRVGSSPPRSTWQEVQQHERAGASSDDDGWFM